MEIDMKWGLPLAMPLALVITVRICWWATGFAWGGEGAETASLLAIFFGMACGGIVTGALSLGGKKLPLRIGKPTTETPND